MWIKVPKSSAQTYTNVNATGKQQYDQADVFYDDANVFYDGVDVNQYTKVNKPTGPTWTKVSKPI